MKSGPLIAAVSKRMLHPKHLWRAIKLRRSTAKQARVYNDPQLKLYGDILPGGFLHYGYFDDPDVRPEDLSLNDIVRAQRRHSQRVTDFITDHRFPVLDVGCGLGGLTCLMLESGLSPVALSPDGNQVRHMKSKYPQVPVIEARLEDIPMADHAGRYGTVITSESLQYLNLEVALPVIEKLLTPTGRWIAYDYFRRAEGGRSGRGHVWAEFERRVLGAGWHFVFKQDDTPNVVPTLRYVYMWAHDIARPMINFSLAKLKGKHPPLYYLLEDAIAEMHERLERNLDVINPDLFAATRCYMLLALERAV